MPLQPSNLALAPYGLPANPAAAGGSVAGVCIRRRWMGHFVTRFRGLAERK